MKYKVLNLKKDSPTVELALGLLEIEIELCRREGIIALKIIHGYGSHGRGGVIKKALVPILASWKKSKFILDYFGGDKWNLFDQDARRILLKDKSIYNDCDISSSNPGITIIEIN